MKKQPVILSLLCLALLFALNVPCSYGAEKTFTLKFALNVNEQHPLYQGAVQFKKTAEERSKGRIEIELYPNNTLGSAPQYAEQIQLGTVDLGLCANGQLQLYVKEYAMVMAPFVFDNLAHAHRTMDGPIGQELAKMAEAKGFVELADWEWGFRVITSKKPINKAEDLKGYKMRVPPELQLMELYKALGCQNTVVSFGELYMALSQGVVDGQCNPIQTVLDQKYYEVQKYLAVTNHAWGTQFVTMSKKVFDTLPEDLRTILKESAREATPMVRNAFAKGEEDAIKQLQAKGMTITQPNIADFRTAVKPAMEPIANFAGKEFAARFLEAVEKARKE